MKFFESCDLFGWVFLSNLVFENVFGEKKIAGGSLGYVFPLDQGEKELSWGKKVPFPIAGVCVHLKALKIASKVGFLFPFVLWSTFTCSVTHLGACYLLPQVLPFSCLESGLSRLI